MMASVTGWATSSSACCQRSASSSVAGRVLKSTNNLHEPPPRISVRNDQALDSSLELLVWCRGVRQVGEQVLVSIQAVPCLHDALSSGPPSFLSRRLRCEQARISQREPDSRVSHVSV